MWDGEECREEARAYAVVSIRLSELQTVQPKAWVGPNEAIYMVVFFHVAGTVQVLSGEPYSTVKLSLQSLNSPLHRNQDRLLSFL